jgi:hypothetical protein
MGKFCRDKLIRNSVLESNYKILEKSYPPSDRKSIYTKISVKGCEKFTQLSLLLKANYFLTTEKFFFFLILCRFITNQIKSPGAASYAKLHGFYIQ